MYTRRHLGAANVNHTVCHLTLTTHRVIKGEDEERTLREQLVMVLFFQDDSSQPQGIDKLMVEELADRFLKDFSS